MSNPQYFHFTLGPVQSFVAQARRTRDFWAGSFILSWLSGVAMQEVIAQCGGDREAILFPKAEPDFLDWLADENTTTRGTKPPTQGSIPNRFKAVVGAGFKPEHVAAAVNIAWQALADEVYRNDLAKLKLSDVQHEKTREIWEQQIAACWEITWAMTDDETDSAILDQSKNWRSHVLPREPGVKCMMMADWQELSGVPRPSAKGLSAFWESLRESGAKAIGSDLREREYLCAIAFVKRRFPHSFQKIGAVDTEQAEPVSMPGGWQLRGWDVGSGRPSVAYMAAVPWLENVIKHANHSQQMEGMMSEFHHSAHDLTKEYGEWASDIACIRKAMLGRQRDRKNQKWRALNGEVFFESELENPNNFPGEKKRAQAADTLAKLKILQRNIQSKAAPFYAVLMMDGDKLGEQMSEVKKQRIISDGLQEFTGQVPGIIREHDGFLVYAGGDDVLAVLPMTTALQCALAVRECYESIFAEVKKAECEQRIATSISAAIEFAHIHMPLTKVLRDAHSLLDDVAKDRCGRDALAVRVWKPGGKALEWALPWQQACEQVAGKNQLVLHRLCDYLSGDDPHNQFSNGFFYKIRERLELFNPVSRPDPCGKKKKPVAGSEFEFNHAVQLMAAEYVNSVLFSAKSGGNTKEQQLQHAKNVVGLLLRQCHDPASGLYNADGALLVRFLVHKGVL